LIQSDPHILYFQCGC